MLLLCGVPHHHAQKRYARVTFFGSHPPSPLFLQHHSCRTSTPDPGGYTHRVSPSSDRFFCPCSGYLTCDCQFFLQLALRIRSDRPRISFLFTGAPSAHRQQNATVGRLNAYDCSILIRFRRVVRYRYMYSYRTVLYECTVGGNHRGRVLRHRISLRGSVLPASP